MNVLRLKDNLTDTIEIKSHDYIPVLNYQLLSFYGLANGTNLTRNYNLSTLQNQYLRIISMQVKYYTDATIWIREAAYDNKLFTVNANSRYATLRSKQQIKPEFFSQLNDGLNTGIVSLFINGNKLPIFPNANLPAIDNLNLNLLLGYTIQSGIDLQLTYSFYSDIDANAVLIPNVQVLMSVETFQNNPTNQVIQNVQ